MDNTLAYLTLCFIGGVLLGRFVPNLIIATCMSLVFSLLLYEAMFK